MKTEEEKQIAEVYERFFVKAENLADRDLSLYPLVKREIRRDRFERHLIGMIELYSIRYGDPDQRLEIVDFLENQLFPVGAKSPEMMCHLSYEIWQDFKKMIVSGEYRILGEEKK